MAAEDPWDNYAKVIPHADIIYHDIKVIDLGTHRNGLALETKTLFNHISASKPNCFCEKVLF